MALIQGRRTPPRQHGTMIFTASSFPAVPYQPAMQLAGALGMAGPLSEMFVEAARGRIPAADVLTALERSRQPGAVRPRLWNIPARNLTFTGRDDLLAAVRDRLLAGHATVVQACAGT
jgi:hypothetical protein